MYNPYLGDSQGLNAKNGLKPPMSWWDNGSQLVAWETPARDRLAFSLASSS
jgi:hypothetical protein